MSDSDLVAIDYDDEGYDDDGYDEEGYNRYGFNGNGYDRNGYDEGGYDEAGFNINGYDDEDYNREGFDIDGYNRQGLDINGDNVNDTPDYLDDRYDTATLDYQRPNNILDWIRVQILNNNFDRLRELFESHNVTDDGILTVSINSQSASSYDVNIDLNHPDRFGTTMLHTAFKQCNPDIVRLLIQHGITEILHEYDSYTLIDLFNAYTSADAFPNMPDFFRMLEVFIDDDPGLVYREANDGITILSIILSLIHKYHDSSDRLDDAIQFLKKFVTKYYKFPIENTENEIDELCNLVILDEKYIDILKTFIDRGFNFNKRVVGNMSFLMYQIWENYEQENAVLHTSAYDIVKFIVENSRIRIDMSATNMHGETLYDIVSRMDNNPDALLRLLESIHPVDYNHAVHSDAYEAVAAFKNEEHLPVEVPYNSSQRRVHLTDRRPIAFSDAEPRPQDRQSAIHRYNSAPIYNSSQTIFAPLSVHGPLDMEPSEVIDETHVYEEGDDSDEEFFAEPDERVIVDKFRREPTAWQTTRRKFRELPIVRNGNLEDGEIDEGVFNMPIGEQIPGYGDDAAIPLVHGPHTIRRKPHTKTKSRKVRSSLSPRRKTRSPTKKRRHSRGGRKSKKSKKSIPKKSKKSRK